jgi:hypothetical protein
MTSIPAPDLHGRIFHSVLVVAQIADLGLRLEMEDRFARPRGFQEPCAAEVRAANFQDQLSKDTTAAACERRNADRFAPLTHFVPSHTVFFAGRDYTSEQFVAAMREHGIDATLVITPGEVGSTQSYVPPTYTTSCTGFNLFLGCTQTTTTTAGGFAYSKPWAQFTARLFSAEDGQGVWIATATAGGNAFAQSEDLVASMADKTLERLAADKVIQ